MEASELLTLVQALLGHVAHRVNADRGRHGVFTALHAAICAAIHTTITSSILAIATSVAAIASRSHSF
jgi:energy-converting hydrogenase Eha subunit B